MKKEINKVDAAAFVSILAAATHCLTQLIPILDSHPLGGMILTAITAIGGACWVMKDKK